MMALPLTGRHLCSPFIGFGVLDALESEAVDSPTVSWLVAAILDAAFYGHNVGPPRTFEILTVEIAAS